MPLSDTYPQPEALPRATHVWRIRLRREAEGDFVMHHFAGLPVSDFEVSAAARCVTPQTHAAEGGSDGCGA